MLIAILLAAIAAMAITIAGWIFKRPRQWLTGWLGHQIRRIRCRLYLDRRERIQLAIERVAAELAQLRYSQDGNPDNELYEDFRRWFVGHPNARDPAAIYEAHNKRIKELLDSGHYQ